MNDQGGRNENADRWPNHADDCHRGPRRPEDEPDVTIERSAPAEAWLHELRSSLLDIAFTADADAPGRRLDDELLAAYERLMNADPINARQIVLISTASLAAHRLKSSATGDTGAVPSAVMALPERLLRAARWAAGLGPEVPATELVKILGTYIAAERRAPRAPHPPDDFRKGGWNRLQLDQQLAAATERAIAARTSLAAVLGPDHAPVLARALERAAGHVYGVYRERGHATAPDPEAMDARVRLIIRDFVTGTTTPLVLTDGPRSRSESHESR